MFDSMCTWQYVHIYDKQGFVYSKNTLNIVHVRLGFEIDLNMKENHNGK